MANKASRRRAWTPANVREMKALARKKTPVAIIARTLRRFRGRDTAKGIQYRALAGYAGMTRRESPRERR
jgi:hypothetical protein